MKPYMWLLLPLDIVLIIIWIYVSRGQTGRYIKWKEKE